MTAGINLENARGCLILLRYRARWNCIADIEAAAKGLLNIRGSSTVFRSSYVHMQHMLWYSFTIPRRRLLRFRGSLVRSARKRVSER